MIDWSQPPKETIERGEEWIRGEDMESSKPINIRPERRWTFYAAWAFMIILLVGFLSGTGLVVLKKGQNVVQKYIERIGYGLDNDDGK